MEVVWNGIGDTRALARLALGVFAAIQGIATVAVDFGRTHATNPSWPGHARFHLVWQDLNLLLLAFVEVVLVIWSGSAGTAVFVSALVLAAIPCCGFVLAQISSSRYGGTLSDPNGIAPKRLKLGRTTVEVDGNAVIVYSAFVVLAGIAVLYLIRVRPL